MAAIQSLGALVALQPDWQPGPAFTGIRFYDHFTRDYAVLYREQPNIRTCVDFLARNVAQLGLHVFRRVSDTDRLRLTDHPLPVLLEQPLPPAAKVTRYRLIEALMADLGVYFNAYWLKLRQGSTLTGLLRLPPMYVTVWGSLVPALYRLTLGGKLGAPARRRRAFPRLQRRKPYHGPLAAGDAAAGAGRGARRRAVPRGLLAERGPAERGDQKASGRAGLE